MWCPRNPASGRKRRTCWVGAWLLLAMSLAGCRADATIDNAPQVTAEADVAAAVQSLAAVLAHIRAQIDAQASVLSDLSARSASAVAARGGTVNQPIDQAVNDPWIARILAAGQGAQNLGLIVAVIACVIGVTSYPLMRRWRLKREARQRRKDA